MSGGLSTHTEMTIFYNVQLSVLLTIQTKHTNAILLPKSNISAVTFLITQWSLSFKATPSDKKKKGLASFEGYNLLVFYNFRNVA